MNSSDNLRIKSDYGNKTLDERRDARIAEAYVSGGSLRGGTTVSARTKRSKQKHGVAGKRGGCAGQHDHSYW